MAEQGRLRIHREGEVEVELVAAYLADLKRAYDSILLFESIIEGIQRIAHDFPFPFPRYRFALTVGWPVARRRSLGQIRDWPPSTGEVASFVAPSEQLVLSAVRLSSPGSWDFLGTLNPLEVLRQYLNDRHQRRKDREYRESAEARLPHALPNIFAGLKMAMASASIGAIVGEFIASQPLSEKVLRDGLHVFTGLLTKKQPMGYIEPAEMQKTLDLLKQYGGVKTDLPATAFYTNEFVGRAS